MTLLDNEMSSTATAAFLNLHPNLEEISIGKEIDSILVAGFAPSRLPHLKHLRLDWYSDYTQYLNTSPNLVMELLEARKEHLSPFVLHLDHLMRERTGWKELGHFLGNWEPTISLSYDDLSRKNWSPRAWVESNIE